MKKIVLSLLTLTALLHASYQKAQSYYDNKEYKAALKEAKASTDEYENPKLHLVWARSAEALGLSNEAMSAYERVVMLDENDSSSRMALLKIYKDTDRGELASELGKELQNYNLTPAQRNSLKMLTKENSNSLKAKASISLGHDSNINVSADGGRLDDYYGSIGSNGEKETLFARMNAEISYINELGSKGGWYLRSDAKLYYQNNFDASFYNLFVGDVSAGIGYARSRYTLYLPVDLSYVNYLEVSLLTQVNLQPRINISLSKNFILNLNVKYSNRDYGEANYKGMSDSSYGGGVGIYYLFSKNYLYATALYEDFSSTEAIHYSYIDKSMLTFTTGINYELSSWLTGKLDYRFRQGSYDDSSDLLHSSTEKRQDNYNQVELKLSHFFTKHYELYFSDRYGNNSSNYVPGEYTKNIAMFGLSANY